MGRRPVASIYLVYALLDPVDVSARYVGKSTTGQRRARQHALPFYIRKDESSNWQKAEWIKRGQSDCVGDVYNGRRLGYIIQTLFALPAPANDSRSAKLLHGSALSLLERVTIRWLRTEGAPLLNRGDGGETIIGPWLDKKQSPESNAKRSATQKGRKRDPESVAKTAAAHRGMRRSQETRDRIRAAQAGKPETEASRRANSLGQQKRHNKENA